MKKIILTSLFSLIAILSLNASASVTLEWNGTPTSTNSNVQISSQSTSNTLNGQVFFYGNQSNGFSHEWNFNTIDLATKVSVGIVSLYGQFVGAQVTLDGVLVPGTTASTAFGNISYWSFSQILSGGSHSLLFSADSVDVQNGLSLYNVNLTASPIPAAVWLFGSAILGIGGLASRRKTISEEI